MNHPKSSSEIVDTVYPSEEHIHTLEYWQSPSTTLIAGARQGWSKLHWAALMGTMDKVPPHIFSASVLTEHYCAIRNIYSNVLHIAAQFGHLGQIPPKHLTEEALLSRDTSEMTPLHVAALSGKVTQFPIDLITQPIISATDKCGWTALHWGAQCHHLWQFPIELLTEYNLLQPARNKGKTAIDLVTPLALAVISETSGADISFIYELKLTDRIESILGPERVEKYHEARRDKQRLKPEENNGIELY